MRGKGAERRNGRGKSGNGGQKEWRFEVEVRQRGWNWEGVVVDRGGEIERVTGR